MNGPDGGELLLAAGDAAGVVATALILFAVSVAALRRQRGLAETGASWGLGFGVAHVVLGALGGAGGPGLAAVLGGVAAVSVLAAAAAGWWRADGPARDANGAATSRDRPTASGQVAPRPVPPPAARVHPGPTPTHLWSSDGYREVTGRPSR